MSPADLALIEALPLHSRTSAEWARSVLADPIGLLIDHAFLEKKAATNAMELMTRWPDDWVDGWVDIMTAVARDEAAHLAQVTRLLSRRGYGIPEELIERDFSEPYVASKAVTAAWLGVYHNAEKDWDLYEMAERLTDLDQKFQLWRFHHLKTVERVIGYKPGTGGTGGVSYLAKALELKFFPELWQVRTSM